VFERPVKEQGERFIVDISVPQPTAEELAETNLVKIVRQECSDEEVNFLAWKCLGKARGKGVISQPSTA
jgi:hypothetical protein